MPPLFICISHVFNAEQIQFFFISQLPIQTLLPFIMRASLYHQVTESLGTQILQCFTLLSLHPSFPFIMPRRTTVATRAMPIIRTLCPQLTDTSSNTSHVMFNDSTNGGKYNNFRYTIDVSTNN